MASWKDWLNDKLAQGKTAWAQYNNRKFKEAAMALCARIAAAEGGVSNEEKANTAQVIAGIPELAVFDPSELYNLFEKFCKELDKPFIGKVVCDRAIAGIKGDAGACAAAAQIALAIAMADGEFQVEEQVAFKEAAAAMGLDPTPYLPSK